MTVLCGCVVGGLVLQGSDTNLLWRPPCRALKTKHETPKYGLIYHASLIGQTSAKHKGKISRVLAAKCALAIRVDALGDSAVGGEHGRSKGVAAGAGLMCRASGVRCASGRVLVRHG